MLVIPYEIFKCLKFLSIYYPRKKDVEQLKSICNKYHVISIYQSELPLNLPNIIATQQFSTTIIYLTKSLDEIYAKFDRKSCRYEIRKVDKIKNRVRIETNNDVKLAYDMLIDFIKKKQYTRPVKFKIFKTHAKYSDIFIGYLDGEPIVMHMLLRDPPERVRLLHSASRRFENEFFAKYTAPLSRYMHWYEIQKYKKEGFKIYDFGGIDLNPDSPRYGITKFKLSFGGAIITEYNHIIVKNRFLFQIRGILRRTLWGN